MRTRVLLALTAVFLVPHSLAVAAPRATMPNSTEAALR
jgi:hypothetical protein